MTPKPQKFQFLKLITTRDNFWSNFHVKTRRMSYQESNSVVLESQKFIFIKNTSICFSNLSD